MVITIHNLQKKIRIDPRKLRATIRRVLAAEAGPCAGALTVCLVTDRFIRDLNRRFHGRDSATDVLAFDLAGKEKKLLADIYISADTAVRNARVYGQPPGTELMLYLIHGVLHLAGYRDATARQRAVMRRKEQKYLG